MKAKAKKLWIRAEVVDSCSSFVSGNVSVLNSTFKYYCIIYKSFYTGM